MVERTPRVLVDTYAAIGPDRALEAAAKISLMRGTKVVVAGPEATLRSKLSSVSYDPMFLQIADAGVAYPRRTGDHLASQAAARAALPTLMGMLRAGDADALVTASPSDLVLQLCSTELPRIEPDLPLCEAAVFPTMKRRSSDDPLALLVDVSGRRSNGPHELVAHGLMGAAYARVVTGVRQPHVALLSTGLAASQGPSDVVIAHELLRHAHGFHFAGNVRAIDLPRGLADVVVTDGFSGYAVHGLLAAITDLTVDAARYAWKAKVSWRVAMSLLRKGVGMLKRVSEFQQYGGAPVLGLKSPVIVADPSSSSAALSNAIKLAAKCVNRDLSGEIERTVGENDGWRPPAAASDDE